MDLILFYYTFVYSDLKQLPLELRIHTRKEEER